MNSFFNNNVSPYEQYAQGMTYGQAPKDLMWTNALTPEEEKALHKGPSSLSLDIPKEDMYRAKCTHRDPNTKQFTIKQNSNGTVTCLKCGATFNIVDKAPIEEIMKVIGGTIDILQTTKMAYIDMTPEVIQTYFIILPFLEIAPKLYEAAMTTLNNATPGMGMTNNFVPGDMFTMLNQAVGTMGMPMNPQYMAPPVSPYAPNYQQQPNMMGGMNNMGMSQVPYNQNPLQTQYNPQPVQNVTQPAPQANAMQQQAAPQEGEAVKVNRAFDLG